MKYNKYLKELGMTRKMFWRLKHKGIYNELERSKFGANYHEMWNLTTVLACEIYCRLKLMHDKYYYACNFQEDADGTNHIHDTDSDKIDESNFDKVLWSLKEIIKQFTDDTYDDKFYTKTNDEEEKLNFEAMKSNDNKIWEGLHILGNNFYGLGI